MAELSFPLVRNEIRGAKKSNAYGMVRNAGKRPHQGWDLEADPGTPVFAIADGQIVFKGVQSAYGNVVVLEFKHQGQVLYAAYAHLSLINVFEKQTVTRGEMLGRTGHSGNAASLRAEDQHLHFEIRTSRLTGKGLANHVDPATLYGAVPIGAPFIETYATASAANSDYQE